MGKLSDILRNGDADRLQNAWNATAAAGEFGPVPRGVYVCHATKGELESSRSKGTPGYKVEFTVIDGDFKGRKLWLDCWLTPAALPQSKRDLAKLGITSPSQMEQPLPKWIRCNVTAVVRRDDDAEGDAMRLRHLKSRHGEARDVLLRFDRPRMSFAAVDPRDQPDLSHTKGKRARGRNGKLLSELADLWNRPAAADDIDDEGGEP